MLRVIVIFSLIMLLPGAARAVVSEPEINFNRPLVGIIGDLPVHMMLSCYQGRLTGSYYYTGNRIQLRNWHTDLQLDGKLAGDRNFQMNEQTGDDFASHEPAGVKQTGSFKGKLEFTSSKDQPEITIKGEWRSDKGNRILPFSLSTYHPAPGNGLKLQLKNLTEVSRKFNYTIKANYPQFDNAQSPALSRFNKEIVNELMKNIKAFKSNVIDAGMYGPHEQDKNTIDIDYEITFASNSLISVVFYSWEWYTGYVIHDIYAQFTFNYDLEKEKQLTLADLCEAKSGYLTGLASICRPVVNRTSFRGDIQTGATIKNYSSFFLTDRAVVFNYQVDHSLGGFAEIYLPLKELEKYLNPAINKLLTARAKE